MPTVAQPYSYAVASIPGGTFPGTASDHLLGMIAMNIPAGVNPVVNLGGGNVTVAFDADLTTADKATLDTLVPRSTDYFIVTIDGGVTDIGEPGNITKANGVLSSTTITLQYKDGTGANKSGYADVVSISAPLMTINSSGGAFDGTGKFQVTIGAELSRGTVEIDLSTNSVLPPRTIIARWT